MYLLPLPLSLSLSLSLLLLCPGMARVLTGSEVLRSQAFSPMLGHRVAILSNPSGVFPDSMEHIVGE
jgi:hypothetical protein